MRNIVTLQAYQFALDLTPTQERAARSHIGASRFAYNHLLTYVKAVLDQRAAEESYGVPVEDRTPYVNVSHYGLRRTWNERKDSFAPWWGENSKEAYSDGARRLADAMGNYFDSRSGKRAGRRMGFPRKRLKTDAGSVRFTTGTIRVEPDRHHVTLPRLGTLRTHESTRKLARRLGNGTARVLAATLTRRGGRWFVVLTTDVERALPEPRVPREERVIGIDLGISTLYTGATPDGRHVLTVENPRHTQQSEALLRKVQRNLSRKQGPDRRTGQAPSNRWLKAKRRMTRIHRDTANRRLDLIHKTTTHLAKNYDMVVIETLNVTGMVANRRLAKHISDAAFAEFGRQLSYKTEWYGSQLVTADRWFPSSKTCSDCPAVKTKLLLSEREYVCSACGTAKDRDVNAAINLARLWLSDSTTAGSRPAAGRGGMQKTKRPQGRGAAASETSIPQQPARVA